MLGLQFSPERGLKPKPTQIMRFSFFSKGKQIIPIVLLAVVGLQLERCCGLAQDRPGSSALISTEEKLSGLIWFELKLLEQGEGESRRAHAKGSRTPGSQPPSASGGAGWML